MSEEAKRDKFVIEVDEPFEFKAIASTKYITSNDFCSKVSELFKNVFADYEGCKFEMAGNEPTVSLYFNHGEYDEKATVACERTAKNVGSSVIDRTRSRDRLLRDGDRYYLTEDGKDVIKDLLCKRYYNNGNPDFGRIVSEQTERGPVNSYFVAPSVQYTKVAFISLDRLCSLLFGSEDEDGASVDYEVTAVSAINPVYAFNGMPVEINYVLHINQVSAKELADFYNKLGIGGVNGTNIIR